MLRRRYWLFVLFLLVATAGYAIYWHALADRVARGFEQWVVARIAEGHDVKFARYGVTGFPGRIELTIETPSIADPRHPAQWAWSGERLVAHIQPWNLSRSIINLGPVHEFAWDHEGQRRSLKAVAAKALASARFLLDGRPERFDIDIGNLNLSGGGLAQAVLIERLQVHQRRNDGESPMRPSDSFDLALRADRIALPPDRAGPLGPTIQRASADLLLEPPFPQGLQEIAAWRDAGGIVDVRRFDVIWGPLDMDGNGTITLDKEMRPLAALSTSIRGFSETLDRFVQAGQVKPNFVRPAKAAMQLLAKSGPDGRQVLNVPITAQDGILWVGPLQVVELTPVPLLRRNSPP